MWIYILVYKIGIYFFALGVRITSLWNVKARLWIQGRRQWQQVLQQKIKNLSTSPKGREFEATSQQEKNINAPIWIHCASLGEFEQGRPIIEAIKLKYPTTQIILTFFSPSGYEVQKNYAQADMVMYLPLDTSSNAKKFIQIIQPQLAIFIKYEFWYECLKMLAQQKIPTLLVSAIFQQRHVFFKWYGGFYRYMLGMFKHVFVQNESSLQLLQSIHIHNASIAGDTRFDRVSHIASSVLDLPIIEKFCANRKVIVAGSTWPTDETMLIQAAQHIANTAWIIVPHELHLSHIQNLQTQLSNSVLYSTVSNNKNIDPTTYTHLIIDNVGMLSSIYRYATIVYVGGGFGKAGIHNILEPAAHGKPVIFGPVFHQFMEADAILKAGGAMSIRDTAEFVFIINHLLDNTNYLDVVGKKAGTYVQHNKGATAHVLRYIEEKHLLTSMDIIL